MENTIVVCIVLAAVAYLGWSLKPRGCGSCGSCKPEPAHPGRKPLL